MRINYQYFDEEELFIQQFVGLFSAEEYIKYARNVFPHLRKHHKVSKVIIDFRKIEFNEDFKEVEEGVGRMSRVRNIIMKRFKRPANEIRVFYVDKPLPTVVVELFIVRFPHAKHHYCSTAGCVSRVLHPNNPDLDIDKMIQNLENSFGG